MIKMLKTNATWNFGSLFSWTFDKQEAIYPLPYQAFFLFTSSPNLYTHPSVDVINVSEVAER